MKFLPLIIRIIICIVVDYFALQLLGQPATPSYRAETMAQFFTGTAGDWIGLIMFNLLMLFTGVAQAYEFGWYNEVGSSAKTIAIGFVAPIAFLILIYVA